MVLASGRDRGGSRASWPWLLLLPGGDDVCDDVDISAMVSRLDYGRDDRDDGSDALSSPKDYPN